ncbi:MAG TPA: sigma-70 family RNA polymerase sigma factor [Chloroflexia bacterium]|nr:sigma-70 family RNA polymerase sigma factor [Chloroflexia bacterium]
MSYEETNNDQILIEACLSGEESAWEALVRKYERLIFATCRRYGLQQEEAEDIFGKVCLTLLQHLEGLKDRSRLASWLITTTSRECWHFRKSAVLVESTSAKEGDGRVAQEEVVDEGLLPEETLLQLERQQQVRECMQHLPERCKKLIWYLFYDASEPPYTQIAAALGIPVASIGPNRARCLDKLRQLLQKVN